MDSVSFQQDNHQHHNFFPEKKQQLQQCVDQQQQIWQAAASTSAVVAEKERASTSKKAAPAVPEWGLSLLDGATDKSEHLAALLSEFEVEVVPSATKPVSVLCDDIASRNNEDAFYVVDLGVVLRKVSEWKKLIPRARPHFAIKCCPDTAIMTMLAHLGLGFDCASRAEITQVLALGVPATSIVYANPCKQASMLQWVSKNEVYRMTFDNVTELHKIKMHCPSAQLILRIAVDDSQSTCKFNSKFGARAKDVPVLLREARKLELDVMGVSFHVGSGCGAASVFPDAIRLARGVFDMATELGFVMTLLDMGGGFPGHDYGSVTFQDIAGQISPALDKYFPEESNVEIIAEPGRYFVSESHTLATTIIAKRRFVDETAVEEEEGGGGCNNNNSSAFKEAGACTPPSPKKDMSIDIDSAAAAVAEAVTPQVAYYINDGVYGSFNCIMFDHAIVTPFVLVSANPVEGAATTASKIFGPTCDSMDCVMQRVELPSLEVGDWLYFPNMGAYTRAAASAFNGFAVPHAHYIIPRI